MIVWNESQQLWRGLVCQTLVTVLWRHLVDNWKNTQLIFNTPTSSAYLDNVSLEFPADFLNRHLVFRLKREKEIQTLNIFVLWNCPNWHFVHAIKNV